MRPVCAVLSVFLRASRARHGGLSDAFLNVHAGLTDEPAWPESTPLSGRGPRRRRAASNRVLIRRTMPCPRRELRNSADCRPTAPRSGPGVSRSSSSRRGNAAARRQRTRHRSLGLQPGVIFTLKNIDDSLKVNQQNRLHPFYQVYIDDDGQIVADHAAVMSPAWPGVTRNRRGRASASASIWILVVSPPRERPSA